MVFFFSNFIVPAACAYLKGMNVQRRNKTHKNLQTGVSQSFEAMTLQ